MTCQPAERIPQTQKIKQHEKTEKQSEMKDHGENSKDQTNEEGISSLPEK